VVRQTRGETRVIHSIWPPYDIVRKPEWSRYSELTLNCRVTKSSRWSTLTSKRKLRNNRGVHVWHGPDPFPLVIYYSFHDVSCYSPSIVSGYIVPTARLSASSVTQDKECLGNLVLIGEYMAIADYKHF
jgi:hypothetical protein